MVAVQNALTIPHGAVHPPQFTEESPLVTKCAKLTYSTIRFCRTLTVVRVRTSHWARYSNLLELTPSIVRTAVINLLSLFESELSDTQLFYNTATTRSILSLPARKE